MFQQMLEDDDETPYEAARYAYEKDLKPHLSWPLQKVCQAAMTRLKPIQNTQATKSRRNQFDVKALGGLKVYPRGSKLRRALKYFEEETTPNTAAPSQNASAPVGTTLGDQGQET